MAVPKSILAFIKLNAYRDHLVEFLKINKAGGKNIQCKVINMGLPATHLKSWESY